MKFSTNIRTNFIVLYINILCLLFSSTAEAQQWTQCNGPFGGSVRCYTKSGENLFVGTDGGVFVSRNNGTNWKALNKGLTNLRVYDLVFNDTNLFAATVGNGVFRSTDYGASWNAVNSGLYNYDLYVYSLAVMGSDVYAGTVDNIFRTTNNGTTWIEVDKENKITSNVSSLFTNENMNYILAGTGTLGVFLSQDGKNWKNINLNLKKFEQYSFAQLGSTVFIGTSEEGLYHTTDNGKTWAKIGIGLSDTIRALTVFGNELIAATGYYPQSNIFISSDNGINWIQVNSVLSNKYTSKLFTDGVHIYASAGRGIYHSTDYKNWSEVNEGMNSSTIISLILSGVSLIAISNGGAYHSSDEGSSWTAINASNYFSKVIVKGSNLYASSNDGFFVSTDNGLDWTLVNSDQTSKHILSLAVSETTLFAGTENGVYLSTDDGKIWTEANSGLTKKNIYIITASTPNIFAGTYDGSIYLSVNNGTSWEPINTGMDISIVNTIITNGLNVYLTGSKFDNSGYHSVCLRSTNNGKSWTEINDGLQPDDAIYAFAVSGNNLFAGTSQSGVYLSTNNGTNWIEINNGLLNKSIQTLLIGNATMYAGTDGSGVWKYDITTLGTENEPMHVPPHLICYPNPATNTLTIDRSSLPFSDTSLIKYTISTLTGSKLLEFDKNEPQFSVPIEAIGSGVYYLLAKQGVFSSVSLFTVIQ